MEIEQEAAPLEESTPEIEEAEIESEEEAPKEEKKTFTTEQKYARVTRLAQKYAKELGIEPTVIKVEAAPEKKGTPGELDETQLDYLDLKGITEPEDIEVIQKIIQKTGVTVRQALKDDYVVSKLNANKTNREVKAATPSSTKRGGNQAGDLAAAVAKYEANGTLPEDFELRSAVVNALVERKSVTRPPWQR